MGGERQREGVGLHQAGARDASEEQTAAFRTDAMQLDEGERRAGDVGEQRPGGEAAGRGEAQGPAVGKQVAVGPKRGRQTARAKFEEEPFHRQASGAREQQG